ncbi:MAG: hypothetical protein JJU15_05290 [Pararhodobacter sp.]|nr:hypothetical protein [Pararhodobacter sp.]
MTGPDRDDPKGLIRESYRIDGISDAECRSVLVDWALSLDGTLDQAAALERLRQHYGVPAPDHPMSHLLNEAAAARPGPQPTRRGGRAGRFARG